MIGRRTAHAQTVVAIFIVAMFYASVCSATCALGRCPNKVQHSDHHDCDHHSSGSSSHGPQKPDCSKHGHPSLSVVKADGVRQFHLASARSLDVRESAGTRPAQASGLAAFLVSAGFSAYRRRSFVSADLRPSHLVLPSNDSSQE